MEANTFGPVVVAIHAHEAQLAKDALRGGELALGFVRHRGRVVDKAVASVDLHQVMDQSHIARRSGRCQRCASRASAASTCSPQQR